MKVTYNRNLKIAGIGIVPWSRVGLEKWFPAYKIASYYGWDNYSFESSKIVALKDRYPYEQLPKLQTQHLLNNTFFQNILLNEFNGYNLLTYKPVSPPDALKSAKFLSSNQSIAAKLENKAYFRNYFSKLGIRFPEFTIYERTQVSNTTESLKLILKDQSDVILQDAVLSGGKGTFIIHDEISLRNALATIDSSENSQTLVVSKRIVNAKERTLQCVVTRHGVFVGPMQKQIIGHPMLANLHVKRASKFCGAEISVNDPLQDSYSELKSNALIIGKELQSMGYKGIFGVDSLIDESGKVYTIEVNARITGVTPLLSKLYRQDQDIPFQLLHTLELLDQEYTISGTPDERSAEGSLLIMHCQNEASCRLVKAPKSGMYEIGLKYCGPSFEFSQNDTQQTIVQYNFPSGYAVRPAERLSSIFSNYPVLDDNDELASNTVNLIKSIAHETVFSSEIELKHGQ